jgi:S-(hydroxymethyl)mycothiol dehydrogenase
VHGVVSRSKGAPVTLEEIVVPAPGPGEAVVDVKTCGSGGLRRLELASRVRRVPGLPAGAAGLVESVGCKRTVRATILNRSER